MKMAFVLTFFPTLNCLVKLPLAEMNNLTQYVLPRVDNVLTQIKPHVTPHHKGQARIFNVKINAVATADKYKLHLRSVWERHPHCCLHRASTVQL